MLFIVISFRILNKNENSTDNKRKKVKIKIEKVNQKEEIKNDKGNLIFIKNIPIIIMMNL